MTPDKSTLHKIKVLESVSLFKNCSASILEEIGSSLEELEFDKDQMIFAKGDQLQALYIIEQGRVKAHDGDYLFAEFGENEFFGEYSLIDESIRSASVTTLKKTRLLKLDRWQFDQLVEKNPKFSTTIMQTLIKRLRNCNVLEESMHQKSQELQDEKEQIEIKKQELENLNATKDKFFSLIAHDLKNPFNTIIGLSELLLYRFDSYPKEKIREFVTQIYNYSTHTYTLLDNMLQWARSQTRQIEVISEWINISDLIQENINLMQNKADEKNITIEPVIDHEAEHAYADENMVSTVIRNLLSNAIKFTPENGKVTILSRVNRDQQIQISVEDTGIGISKENIPKLFSLGSGYSTHGTKSEKGTGLGLILCKEFVEKLHGKIWVESEPGQGSIFHVTLPGVEDKDEKMEN